MPQREQVDVAVVGGGVIGVSAALALAEAGVSVAVIEKGRVGAEQSGRNWGWIRRIGRHDAEMPIMIEAGRLWRGMAERVGADVGYREEGVAYLAQDDAERDALEKHVAAAARHQTPLERLDAAAIERLIRGRAGAWTSGVRAPRDGRAEPSLATPAMARALAARGGRVFEQCAARALDRAAGRVVGVVTERGRIGAEAVVVAGGAWTALFLARHGIDFPQLSVRATVARTAPAPDLYAGAARDSAFAFRRREDGGYTIALMDRSDLFIGPSAMRHVRAFAKSAWAARQSVALRPAAPSGFPDAWLTKRRWRADAASPFEARRVLDPKPASGALAKMRRRMDERLPALAKTPIAAAWAGMIDVTPDELPTMDAAPGWPGLWIASGFSGHGFGLGPAAGRIMADLVRGRPAGHELTPFRFDRFAPSAR